MKMKVRERNDGKVVSSAVIRVTATLKPPSPSFPHDTTVSCRVCRDKRTRLLSVAKIHSAAHTQKITMTVSIFILR